MNFSHLAPYTYSVISTEDDPRLASMIMASDNLSEADVVLLGVPTDEGVRRNGGRVGAAQAPAKIREFLGKLTPFAGPIYKHQLNKLKVVDLGDVIGDTLEEVHDHARAITYELCNQGKIVIALGGGHDVTYPLASGFALSYRDKSPGLINLDAHLDVRPKKDGKHHSGSSFRLLIEEGIFKGTNFCEIGIQSFAASKTHWDWLIQQGGTILTFDDTTSEGLASTFSTYVLQVAHSDLTQPVYFSFDIDAVRSADAPGVSAPAPIGYLAEEAFEVAVAAGLSENIRMMDLVEMNPTYDVDDKTARLCARVVAGFLIGVANRGVK